MKVQSDQKTKSPFQDYFPMSYDVAYKIDDINEVVRMHSHSQYEFIICIDDGIDFLLNGNIIKLKKNSMLLINNHDFHIIIGSNHPNCRRYVFMFHPDILLDFAKDHDLLQLFSDESLAKRRIIEMTDYQVRELTQKADKIIYYDGNQSKNSVHYAKLAVIESILKLNELAENNTLSTPHTNKSTTIKIEQILDHITNNIEGDLSLDVISKKFFISKSYLATLFKASTGFTVNKYIIMQRIFKARQILENSNASVAEVASEVGFNDYAHFLRTFKKYVGTSPKQYAKLFL